MIRVTGLVRATVRVKVLKMKIFSLYQIVSPIYLNPISSFYET